MNRKAPVPVGRDFGMRDAPRSLLETAPAAAESPRNIKSWEGSVLLAEADHRIANHLTLLVGYVRLKTADLDRRAEPPSRRSVHDLLEGVGAQISALARLHRALVSDAGPDSGDLALHLHEVCAPFASGLGGSTRMVEDLEPGCLVRPEQVLPVIQVAAEVLTNALKHAAACASEDVAVVVRCHKDAAGQVRVEIIDNGGGLPPGFDPAPDGGVGFRLIRGLGQKLGARTAFESTPNGLRFSLTLAAPATLQQPARTTMAWEAPR